MNKLFDQAMSSNKVETRKRFTEVRDFISVNSLSYNHSMSAVSFADIYIFLEYRPLPHFEWKIWKRKTQKMSHVKMENEKFVD